jgi:hypothetical protein
VAAILGDRHDHVGVVDTLVARGVEPASGGVDHAVEGDVLGDDQLPHG